MSCIHVKPEGHVEKIGQLRATLEKLDPVDDTAVVVETCYAVAMHALAILTESRHQEHLDTHQRLPAFLADRKLADEAALFRELDALRTAHWYGKRRDPAGARRAQEIASEILGRAGVP